MVFASTGRYHSRKTPPWLPAVCVSPRGVSFCLLHSEAQDSQVYDLGSFQTPVLTLGLRTDENSVCVPFKSGVCCFQYPSSSLNTSCWFSKPGILELPFLVQDLTGSLIMGAGPLLLGYNT